MATLTVKVSWRSAPVPVVLYGGRRYTQDFANCLEEWKRLAAKAGISLIITQGGFNGSNVSASAGTHAGDAVDVSVRNSSGSYLTEAQVTKLITLGRSVGLATWFRTTRFAKWGTRAHGFSSYHIHAVPNKWGVASPEAAEQADSYRRGRDGLASDQKDLGPGHVSTYRTRTWAEYKKLNSGANAGAGAGSSTPPASKPPVSSGGLTMSDINSILKELENIKEQNKAIHNSIAGRDAIEERKAEDAKATWQFPIHRTSGPVMVISEIASQTDMLRSILPMVSSIAKSSGVDEKTIVNGVVAALIPVLRETIISAQGDVDLEAAETFADAVLVAFKEQFNK